MARRSSISCVFTPQLSCASHKLHPSPSLDSMTSPVLGEEEQKFNTALCRCPKRWVLAFALFFMRLCHAALRQDIGIALVCMSHTLEDEKNMTSLNVTPEQDHLENITEFHWSSVFEGHVLSGPYYGFLAFIPLAGYLDHALGSCRLLMLSLVVGGLLSTLTPILTRQHQYLLVASRVLTGAANGVVKPAVFSLWANWAPASERGILTSVEYSGSAVGGILTFFASGFLCSIPVDGGWPFVFYVFGGLSLVCAAALAAMVHDSPELHPSISPQELDLIHNDKAHEPQKGKVRAPWGKMVKSGAVWAIVVAHSCHHWVFAAMVAYLPMYIRDVLKYDITQNGMLSALPFAGSMAAGVVGGLLADRMQRTMAIVHVRKVFQLAGSVGFALPMYIVSWLDERQRPVAITLLVVAITLLNLTSLAYRINSLDIAPRYASFVTSMSFTIATAFSLTAPLVTSAILETKSHSEWKKVLTIVTAVSVFGGIFYVIFARGDVQRWARSNTYDVNLTVSGVAARYRKQSIVDDFKEQKTCLVLSVRRLQQLA